MKVLFLLPTYALSCAGAIALSKEFDPTEGISFFVCFFVLSAVSGGLGYVYLKSVVEKSANKMAGSE